MELLQKKKELLEKFYQNQLLLREFIQVEDIEHIEKHVDLNDYYIRLIDELDQELEFKKMEVVNEEINTIGSYILRLHQENSETLYQLQATLKEKTKDVSKNAKAVKQYVNNSI